MSKLIVEMEMPKDCPMCPMAHYNKLDEFTGCEVAAGKLFAVTRDKAYAESICRPDWCPIKGELPDEHGDLIDRSVLWKLMCTYDDYQGAKEAHDLELIHRDSILFAIETAPTVIAAERKESV